MHNRRGTENGAGKFFDILRVFLLLCIYCESGTASASGCERRAGLSVWSCRLKQALRRCQLKPRRNAVVSWFYNLAAFILRYFFGIRPRRNLAAFIFRAHSSFVRHVERDVVPRETVNFFFQVKKTSFARGVRCASLGSRRTLCGNERVYSLKSDARMTDACLDLQKNKKKRKRDKKNKKKDGKGGELRGGCGGGGGGGGDISSDRCSLLNSFCFLQRERPSLITVSSRHIWNGRIFF